MADMTAAQEKAVARVRRLVLRRNRIRSQETAATALLQRALLDARKRGVTVEVLRDEVGVSRTLIYRLAPGTWSPDRKSVV